MAIKSSRGISTGRGTPRRTEGQNGDITIRHTKKGTHLYVKQSNKWNSVDLNIDSFNMLRDVEDLKEDVRKLQLKAKNTPIVDKILFKKRGQSTIAIQNDGGEVTFRNSANSADVSLKNPKITAAVDGGATNPAIVTTASNVITLAANAVSAAFYVKVLSLDGGGTYDNAIIFQTGSFPYWTMGYVGDSNTIFRINPAGNLNADVLQLNNLGDLTIDGDLTVSGGDISGGTDTSLVLSADLNVDVKLDADNDAGDTQYFRVLNASGVAKATIDESGNLTANSYNHFMDVKIHQWYTTDGNQDYIPFGGSQVETSLITDAYNDDTLFIAPYDGSLEFIKIQSAVGVGTPAGSTNIALRVNGTTQTAVNASIANETTQTFTWSANNTFSAGDRLRISFDPALSPKYVTATSVWKYTI